MKLASDTRIERETAAWKGLLGRMVAQKQLSATDADTLARQASSTSNAPKTEEDVLRWLAKEYDVAYTALEDIEPDRQLLSLFPARILLKEELLPLRRVNGSVEVATCRLFATQGLDTLKTLTGLKLKPVLAPSEAIQRGPQGAFVYVVRPDRTAQLRRVDVAASEGGQIAVKQGLAPGEAVVVDGAEKLQDGARVEPTMRERPPARTGS